MSGAVNRPNGFMSARTGVREEMVSKSSSASGISALSRDGEEVEHAVGGSSGRCYRGDRVLERRSRDDLAGSEIIAKCICMTSSPQ